MSFPLDFQLEDVMKYTTMEAWKGSEAAFAVICALLKEMED